MPNATTSAPSSVGISEASLSASLSAQLYPAAASEEVFQFSLAVWTVTVSVGVVGNALLCLTIGTSPSLKTAMNTYVFGIGLVDLLTCSMLLPLRMAVEKMERGSEDVPSLLYSGELLARTVTDLARLLLIQALSVERYQAIARPFSISKVKARRRAIVVSLVLWGLVMVLSAVSLRYFCDTVLLLHCDTTGTWGNLELYVELPLTLTSILSISLSYSLILLVLREQREKMADHAKQPKANQVAPAHAGTKPKVNGSVGQANGSTAGLERNAQTFCPCYSFMPIVCKGKQPLRTGLSRETVLSLAPADQTGKTSSEIIIDTTFLPIENTPLAAEVLRENHTTRKSANEARVPDDLAQLHQSAGDMPSISAIYSTDGVTAWSYQEKPEHEVIRNEASSPRTPAVLNREESYVGRAQFSPGSAHKNSSISIPISKFVSTTNLVMYAHCFNHENTSPEVNAEESIINVISKPQSDVQIVTTAVAVPCSTDVQGSDGRNNEGLHSGNRRIKRTSISSKHETSLTEVEETKTFNEIRHIQTALSPTSCETPEVTDHTQNKTSAEAATNCSLSKHSKENIHKNNQSEQYYWQGNKDERRYQSTFCDNETNAMPPLTCEVNANGKKTENRDPHTSADNQIDLALKSNSAIAKASKENLPEAYNECHSAGTISRPTTHNGLTSNLPQPDTVGNGSLDANTNGTTFEQRDLVSKTEAQDTPQHNTSTSQLLSEGSEQSTMPDIAVSNTSTSQTILPEPEEVHVPEASDETSKAGSGFLRPGSTIDQRSISPVSSVGGDKRIEVVESDGTVHLEKAKTVASEGPTSLNIEGAVCLMNTKNKEHGRRRVELKAALKVGLLFLSFLLLWTPLPVLVAVIRKDTAIPRGAVEADLLGAFSALASSTAAMDPILYGLLNRQIRTSMHNMLKKAKRKLHQIACVRNV